MAAPAGGRTVGVIDRRFWVAACQNLVRAAVAVLAVCRRRFAGFAGLGVNAERIGLAGIRVTLNASDLLGRGLMGQALHIRVAIDAGEHPAMNRVAQLASIHIEADLFAMRIHRQGGIGMAGEAILVLKLLFRASRAGPGKQRHDQRLSEEFLGRIHAFK